MNFVVDTQNRVV